MKKALQIAGKVLSWVLIVFIIFIVLFIVVSALTVGRENATLFGYKPYVVLSDSMEGVFSAGDMIVSRETDVETLKAGDIITFYSTSTDNYGEVVTHKIRSVTSVGGEAAFVTYGVATDTDDQALVLADNVIGEYVFRIPKLGYFYQFMMSPLGYCLLILLPLVILVAINLVKFIKLFRQYKGEKRAEELAAASEKQAMQDELERLRAQVQQLESEKQAPSVPETPEPKKSKKKRG